MFFWNYIFGSHKLAERALPIRPDDIFLVSYYKSGNTWVRFLLKNLLTGDHPVTFEDIERASPDIYQFRYRDFCNLPSPRLIKSHECFDPRYARVIYIVRDPRDVAISLYHFLRKRRTIDDTFPLAAYAKEWFIRGTGTGVTWREHVGSWMANPKCLPAICATGRNHASSRKLNLQDLGADGPGREFLLVRYEDLFADPVNALAQIVEFLGLTANEQQIRSAVERSSADKMRGLEQREKATWILTKGTREDINFVRAAKSEQWKTTLPAESVAAIESVWGELMQVLGYQLTTSKALEPASDSR